MKRIYEQLYFLKISIKDDQVLIEKKNDFLKIFYHFSFYYLSFLNGVLFILDKKVLYDEAVNIDFRIVPMQRISSFLFFLGFLSLTLTRDLYLNYSKYPEKFKVYHFFFFVDWKTIKKKFNINKKISQCLSQANINNEKILKIIFLFYDFVFFLFYSGIAYFKLKDKERNIIFLFKILLYIHLYIISKFSFKVLVFELLKQMFVLNYISLKIKNLISKLNSIIESNEKRKFPKKHVERLKIIQIKFKLKKVFINYNEILIEREKFKNEDASFVSCFIISISLVFFYLVLIVFYRNYNIVSTIVGSTLYTTIITCFVLPVVLFNLNQNLTVKSF